MTVTTVDMLSSAITFGDGGRVEAAEPRMTEDDGAWQLATFRVETDADVHSDHWEVHPAAEEAVCCLSGALRMYFRPESPDEEETEVKLSAGGAVIVPRGRWHRLELDEPSVVMSVALRRGSRQEKRSDV